MLLLLCDHSRTKSAQHTFPHKHRNGGPVPPQTGAHGEGEGSLRKHPGDGSRPGNAPPPGPNVLGVSGGPVHSPLGSGCSHIELGRTFPAPLGTSLYIDWGPVPPSPQTRSHRGGDGTVTVAALAATWVCVRTGTGGHKERQRATISSCRSHRGMCNCPLLPGPRPPAQTPRQHPLQRPRAPIT